MPGRGKPPAPSLASRLVRAGGPPGEALRTVGPPLQRGSTVLLPDAAALTRLSPPTYGLNALAPHEALREALKTLEAASAVELHPSGLAACSGTLLALLAPGDEILTSEGIYAPVRRFLCETLARFGVVVRFHPPGAPPAETLERITERTRVLYIESPASLTFEMEDVPALAAGARRRGVLTVMDNSWAAGLLFRPLEAGVDVSVQALTKYVCGHSDVFLGSAAVRDPALADRLRRFSRDTGAAVSPDDAHMAIRGLRTLPTRLAAHGRSALGLAEALQGRAGVLEVLHPALANHPGFPIWRRDYVGAAGVFGLRLDGGRREAETFLNALRLFGLGFSWGGYESLAVWSDPQTARRGGARGRGALVRLQIGLEDPDDLLADLDQALEAARRG